MSVDQVFAQTPEAARPQDLSHSNFDSKLRTLCQQAGNWLTVGLSAAVLMGCHDQQALDGRAKRIDAEDFRTNFPAYAKNGILEFETFFVKEQIGKKQQLDQAVPLYQYTFYSDPECSLLVGQTQSTYDAHRAKALVQLSVDKAGQNSVTINWSDLRFVDVDDPQGTVQIRPALKSLNASSGIEATTFSSSTNSSTTNSASSLELGNWVPSKGR